jgi:hypothetical protein
MPANSFLSPLNSSRILFSSSLTLNTKCVPYKRKISGNQHSSQVSSVLHNSHSIHLNVMSKLLGLLFLILVCFFVIQTVEFDTNFHKLVFMHFTILISKVPTVCLHQNTNKNILYCKAYNLVSTPTRVSSQNIFSIFVKSILHRLTI